MGYLEKESRRKARKGEIQKIVLTTIATAGLLGVALVAPNALATLRKLGVDITGRKRESVDNARRKLVNDGLLAYDEKRRLYVTKKGEKKLNIFARRDCKIDKPKKWDKKWRVLIFDIPENRKSMREKVRRTLLEIGFVRLQDSVWVYPYDCEDFIVLLKTDFMIGKDLLYMVVDMIENDKELRNGFKLK